MACVTLRWFCTCYLRCNLTWKCLSINRRRYCYEIEVILQKVVEEPARLASKRLWQPKDIPMSAVSPLALIELSKREYREEKHGNNEPVQMKFHLYNSNIKVFCSIIRFTRKKEHVSCLETYKGTQIYNFTFSSMITYSDVGVKYQQT